ncbi:MAG: hypothetical protein GY906_26380 [bacterium]|nr:hypothetical protein [bacterium]
MKTTRGPTRETAGKALHSVEDKPKTPRWWTVALVVLSCAFLLNAYTAWFNSQEHTLYAADEVRHWSFATGFRTAILNNPVAAINGAAKDIAHREVSVFPAIPVALAMVPLGNSRLAYLFAVINLYGLPSLCIAAFAAFSLWRPRTQTPGRPILVAALITSGLLCGLWIPVFAGYLGIGGVLLCVSVLWLYLRTDAQDLRLSHAVLIGILLALLVLFRRWYVFFTVSALAMFWAEALLVVLIQRPISIKRLLSGLSRPLTSTAACCATLLTLAFPMIIGIAGRDYVDSFSAYRHHSSALEAFGRAISEHGAITIAILVLSSLLLISSRATRRVGLLLAGQHILMFFLFQPVQSHAIQHWYLYLPGSAILMILGMARAWQELRSHRWRLIAAGVLVTVSIVQICHVFGNFPEYTSSVLVERHLSPRQRGDIDEITRLLAVLDRIVSRQPGHIYVLASSSVLTEHVLAFANLSLGASFQSPQRVLTTAQIDRRDGFPSGLFQAQYVILPHPIQVNQPNEQRVVSVPASYFDSRSGPAAAFVPLSAVFRLDNGVVARIWARTRPNTPSEADLISRDLRQIYPDHPYIYEVPNELKNLLQPAS